MKTIKLQKFTGKEIIVDDEDFEWLNDLRGWFVNSKGHIQLRKYKKGGGKLYLSLGRLIMLPPLGMVVDHIDGNPLNNQRKNLRICTQQQNIWNKKVSNVHRSSNKRYWVVRIGQIYIGNFKDKQEAERVAKEKRKEMYGEFVRV
jgi:cytochrome b subunit of formate dehydrogenase